MNCREVQDRICSAPDAAPDSSDGAALESHVAHCAACRRVRDDLAAALGHWRNEMTKTSVPDADREWLAVRRQIRGGGDATQSTGRWFRWLGLPLVAGAAAALVMISPSTPPAVGIASPIGDLVRAENIEAPGNGASTMVFVDDKSGWLIVWASDAMSQTAEE